MGLTYVHCDSARSLCLEKRKVVMKIELFLMTTTRKTAKPRAMWSVDQGLAVDGFSPDFCPSSGLGAGSCSCSGPQGCAFEDHKAVVSV